MKITLNIEKNYQLNSGFDETLSGLVEIAAASFEDSKFKLYGEYFLTDSPEFILKGKWRSFGSQMLYEEFSTRIIARLKKDGNKTSISVETSTNPIFVILFVLMSLSFLSTFFNYKGYASIKNALSFAVFLILIIVVDRFIKKTLIHVLTTIYERAFDNKKQPTTWVCSKWG